MAGRRHGGSGEVVVVRIHCALLDVENMKAIGEDLLGLVGQRPACKLLLNFRKVEYISSGALGTLITLQRRLQRTDARLILCNLGPELYEVFEITKLDRFFTITDDPAADEVGVETRPPALGPQGGLPTRSP